MAWLRREWIYIWYYFTVQFQQIFGWWVLGMVIGSAVSVFAKDRIHRAFCTLQGKRLGLLGIVAASALGIASPLCMYDNSHCRLLLQRRDERQLAGSVYDVLHPAQPPADRL